MDFFIGFTSQIFASIGVIFIFGALISLLRRTFCALMGRSGNVILLITGIVGTPIHELSHALMCVIFGHKITKIRLYSPLSNDGALGYVAHTFNKRSFYHLLGNFFIGSAPVLVGGGVLILLMSLLVPTSLSLILKETGHLCTTDLTSLPISELFAFFSTALAAIFSYENITSWQGLLFIILSVMIASHMELSTSDIKSGLYGSVIISILLLLTDGVIYLLLPNAFASITSVAMSFGLMLSALLSLSLIFLAAMVLVALIFRSILAIFGKRK